ncbi:hypothetical protein HDV00_008557 [Rhizophlyctis rosea]|nr:hypothetical protein HDV00_008557 [Rhizophlyctis rosea]
MAEETAAPEVAPASVSTTTHTATTLPTTSTSVVTPARPLQAQSSLRVAVPANDVSRRDLSSPSRPSGNSQPAIPSATASLTPYPLPTTSNSSSLQTLTAVASLPVYQQYPIIVPNLTAYVTTPSSSSQLPPPRRATRINLHGVPPPPSRAKGKMLTQVEIDMILRVHWALVQEGKADATAVTAFYCGVSHGSVQKLWKQQKGGTLPTAATESKRGKHPREVWRRVWKDEIKRLVEDWKNEGKTVSVAAIQKELEPQSLEKYGKPLSRSAVAKNLKELGYRYV